MQSLIELVGIPVSSNLSEIQYFGGRFHWEVSQTQIISERGGTWNLFYNPTAVAFSLWVTQKQTKQTKRQKPVDLEKNQFL